MPVQLCSDLLHISLPFQAGREERQQLIETGTQQIFFLHCKLSSGLDLSAGSYLHDSKS